MPDMMPEETTGISARVTAVHKERYELVCEHGEIHARLKTKEYYGGFEEFPTTGDFVLIKASHGLHFKEIVESLQR